MSTVHLSVAQSVFVRGHVLTLVPRMAMEYGLTESIFYNQIKYLAAHSKLKYKVRISYGKLQEIHFPFYKKRWVIEIVKRLEQVGLIKIDDSGRVNVFEIPELKKLAAPIEIPEYDEEACEQKKSSVNALMQISVPLAECVGLKEAIILQQVHIRHKGHDGAKWVIRSFEDWGTNTFMFIGTATVKRLFKKLVEQNLLFVKKHSGESGMVNSYRVNYVRVAELLGVSIPEVCPPIAKYNKEYGYKQMEWINPLHPLGV